MSIRQIAALNEGLHHLRQAQQPQVVRHAGAVLAGALRHLLLRQAEVATQPLERARLLHGIQIGALQVFDDGHLHRLLVGYLSNDRRNRRFARQLRRQPAPLTRDQLVAALGQRTHHNRLHNTVKRNGLSKFTQSNIVELGSCLERITFDSGHKDVERLAVC